MKRVTIPTVMSPWECIIDGVKYTYPAGKTMDVPDQVAELIAFYNKSQQEETPESEVKKLEDMIKRIADRQAETTFAQFGIDRELPFFRDYSGCRNSVFRGKNLGSNVTDEQKRAIREGTFDNMYVGDYWEDDEATYIIAGFNCAPVVRSSIVENHVAIFARYNNMKKQMHYLDSAVAKHDVPFLRTKMWTEVLPELLGKCLKKFGTSGVSNMVRTFKDEEQEGNVNTYGYPIMLPSQRQIFGMDIYPQYPSIQYNNEFSSNYHMIDNQFPLFRYPIDFKKYKFPSEPTGSTIWLSDRACATAGYLAWAFERNNIVRMNAGYGAHVCPIFCINGK